MKRLGDLDPYLRELISDVVRQVIREELPPMFAAVLRDHAALTGERDVYVSLKAAGRRVGVRSETLRTWIKQGKLKRYGSHRTWRVRLVELNALMNSADGSETSADRRSAEQIADALLASSETHTPANTTDADSAAKLVARRRAKR